MSHLDGWHDQKLHNDDGTHRTTAWTTSGADLENHEKRIRKHIAEHKARGPVPVSEEADEYGVPEDAFTITFVYEPGSSGVFCCSRCDAHDEALKAAGTYDGKPTWRGETTADWQRHVDQTHIQASKNRRYTK